MIHIKEFDIMIVGAGPAGTSIWLHLNKLAPGLGGRTVMVDKASFPRNKLCGGGIWPWGDAILRRLEIDADFPFRPVSEVAFRNHDQTWSFTSPQPFRMVHRMDFDAALVNAARQRGAVLLENEHFIEAHPEGGALAVRTTRGVYRVRALVGADGALSSVRRSMMPSPPCCLARAVQVSSRSTPHDDQECGPDRLVIDFSPLSAGIQGYVWHFPAVRGDLSVVNHGIVDFRRFAEKPVISVNKALREALRARGLEITPAACSGHPIRWFAQDQPIARPHVILAGDAAGAEPALGGGIHTALAYGEFAATQLLAAVENRDFSFRRYKAALQSHALGRHLTACTQLAHRLYSGKYDPIEEMRHFITDRLVRLRLASLLRQMAPETIADA